MEWFIHDAIAQDVDLFVLDGDLTTYKETIRERNFWTDRLISMADHAPVIVLAGNHGKELEVIFIPFPVCGAGALFTSPPNLN